MSDIGIKDVSHVSIGVSDMERSIAFYRDVFGWEQLFDERMEGEAFERAHRASRAPPVRRAVGASAACASS